MYGFKPRCVKPWYPETKERSKLKSASKRKWALVVLAGIAGLLTGVHCWQEARDDERASVSLLAAVRVGDRISVLMLLDDGGSSNAKDGQKQTPLMLAAERGDIDVARALLDAGADARQRDVHGGTALMRAVVSGNASLVALLIFWKADVNARRADGATALTLAQTKRSDATAQQHNQQKEIVTMLLQAGARQ